MILCGSVSSWIEENILSSTGFLGRVSVDILLDELPLSLCKEFWDAQKNRVSSYEIFKILAITGGVPKYLEEIITEEPAESNIHKMCFEPKGLLFREFNQIFSDLFSKKFKTYSKIVNTLAHGSLNLSDICQSLKLKKGGQVSKYLSDLILAGFVSEDSTWNLKDKNTSKLKKFRLKDNYLRFYLKYIETNKEKITKGLFGMNSLTNMPGWETFDGLAI